MRILLIDNYDSFTYNLFHLLQMAGGDEIVVQKNDRILTSAIVKCDAIVFSPGPGLPSKAGRMEQIIEAYKSKKKMLGVCLGHQAIGEIFGASVVHSGEIIHGEATPLNIVENGGIFDSIPNGTLVGRYHSWIISNTNFPSALKVTATDNQGIIMAIRHLHYDITGVQFHPESIMTPMGGKMIKNWLSAL